MNNKGFTLIETIFSLTVVSFCTLFLVSFLNIMIRHNYDMPFTQDETAIHQMRIMYALSKDINIDFDMLYFTYLGKEMNYAFNENHLILEEGYQVFFRNISDAYFYNSDRCVFISYQRNEKVMKRVIGCE